MLARTLATTCVQHIPAAHPYAASVTHRAVSTLPDPPVPGAPAGRWWPHPALEPDWPATTRADVVHLHFGFEHRSPAELHAWTQALRRAHIALVVTVHDLINPHLGPSRAYDALLDVVIPAADALTTLTTGAAAEIQRRWGRAAHVHPHPHVVAEDWLDRPRPAHEGWVAGVHAKSVRASLDVEAILATARVIRDLPGGVLRLHVHEDALDPAHPRHDPRLTRLMRTDDAVDVRVHGPLSDMDLWTDLLETDLALLPYRHATHSGWLEMCHDLGTDLLAADVGHLTSQRPVRAYTGDASLTAELVRAHAEHRRGVRPARPSPTARRRERDEVRDLHAALYAEVLAGIRV